VTGLIDGHQPGGNATANPLGRHSRSATDCLRSPLSPNYFRDGFRAMKIQLQGALPR